MSRYAQDPQGNLTLIAGNSDYDVIAPKETSPATAPHTTGSQIFYGNALYEVIDDIAIGDTLTVGTNITSSDDITTQINNNRLHVEMVTLPSTTSWDVGFNSQSIDLSSLTGNALGIIGIEINNAYVQPYKWYIRNNAVQLAAQNTANAATTSGAQIYLLVQG